MTHSYWVMPREPDRDRLYDWPGLTIDQARRRWRVENYPARQFHTLAEAQEYAVVCRLAGLVVKIVPSSDVLDERAYREYREKPHDTSL